MGHSDAALCLHGSPGSANEPGLGHIPMFDDPELIADLILEVTSRSTDLPHHPH